MVKHFDTKKIAAKRRKVNELTRESVTVGTLQEDMDIPAVIRPKTNGIQLDEFARKNREYIDELLLAYRALLFRGFDVPAIDQFDKFVNATSDGERLEYRDRTTPRTTKGDRIYSSTEHPADQRINAHNEGTYWLKWPAKLYFYCKVAPETGGQTPISDVRRVYANIDPSIRQKFIDKGMLLARCFYDGLGLTWQSVFQTDSKAEVELFCVANEIAFEWRIDGQLRTRQVRPAVRRHPMTNEFVWFNHAAFYHYTTLDHEIRAALVGEFGQDGLPFNTYYGDGEQIETEVAEHLRQAYAKEQKMFDWSEGDILLLDNMTVSHAREPYKGNREVMVAMTDAINGNKMLESGDE